MALSLIFMGTPDFSVAPLARLIEAGHKIVAVYSQPPRPAGRGMADRKSPVHVLAESHGLTVFTPKNFKDAADVARFAAHDADAAVVVAYGLLLPKAVLDAPRFGCFNLHASKLPRWRGAAPIQRAIMEGDSETAAMIMRMEEGLDTGPVCAAECVRIAPETTAGELHDTLAQRGAALLVATMAKLEAGAIECVPQPETGVTYARKIDKAEAKIDFTRDAGQVLRQIHGLSPFPGAWFEITGGDGVPERIKVLRVEAVTASGAVGVMLDDALTIACGTGALRLVTLQRAGKKVMSACELLRGFPIAKGTRVNHSA